MDGLEARAEPGEAPARDLERVGIAVEPDQPATGRRALEDRLGVAAIAERAVDQDPVDPLLRVDDEPEMLEARFQ